ncbi:hypothetical protein B0H14DRAFT_3559109 [Mycena olivaceomarginata]|nr:hypothetical protein B0H14DRAFT_3559109 [Mycena olivaceomarginata]
MPKRHSPAPSHTPTSPQCCASVTSAQDGAASLVTAIFGLDLSGVLVDVGLSCSPINRHREQLVRHPLLFPPHIELIPFHSGGTTVTCDAPEKEWGGLIAINCIPVTL